MDGLDLRICHWLLDICSHSVRRCHNSCGHSLPFQTHIQITQHGKWTTLSLMMGLFGLCSHSKEGVCSSVDDVSVTSWPVFPFGWCYHSLLCHNNLYLAHTPTKSNYHCIGCFLYGKFVLGEFIAPSDISPSGSLLTFQHQNNETFGSLDNLSAF